MRQSFPQPVPEPNLEAAEVGGLAHEGRAMQVAQARKVVAPVPLKVGKERTLLIQPQILADDFHREHFTVG
jgi:hypothetical protein